MNKKIITVARVNGHLVKAKVEKVKDRTPNKKKVLKISPVEEITIQLLMLNEGVNEILRVNRCEGKLIVYCDNHNTYCVDGARYTSLLKGFGELGE